MCRIRENAPPTQHNVSKKANDEVLGGHIEGNAFEFH
jgi:hypothetical protein